MPRIATRTAAWQHADLAADIRDGELRAATVIDRQGDSEALLRALLNTIAEDGRVIPPTARLRAFCRRLQQSLFQKKAAAVQAAADETHRGSDAQESYPAPPAI